MYYFAPQASSRVKEVLQQYDPNLIQASLDEAYLNITQVREERGMSCEEVGEELRRRVQEHTGLTCSVGIAPNRMLAKVLPRPQSEQFEAVV